MNDSELGSFLPQFKNKLEMITKNVHNRHHQPSPRRNTAGFSVLPSFNKVNLDDARSLTSRTENPARSHALADWVKDLKTFRAFVKNTGNNITQLKPSNICPVAL